MVGQAWRALETGKEPPEMVRKYLVQPITLTIIANPDITSFPFSINSLNTYNLA